MRLPVSLPRNPYEAARALRRPNIAAATLSVRCRHGDVLAQVTQALDGRRVKLAQQKREQLSYSQGVGWVLEIYAERAVDRAFAHLNWADLARRAASCQETAT